MKARRDILALITAHNRHVDHDCPNGRMIYDVVEEIKRALRELINAADKPTNQPLNITNLTGGITPQNVPYPFSVEESSDLFPDGLDPLFGQRCTLTAMELVCDPSADPPTADTTFTVQNAPSSPTSSDTITIPSGQRRAFKNTMSVSFDATQRLHIIAPANLNGVQDLYVSRMLFVPVQV